jgi:hypothetical protein
MKKLYITLVIAMLSYCSYAQNTFPSTGNVWIGTTSPNAPFHVYAGSSNSITTGLKLQGGEGGTSSGSSLLFSSSYSVTDYQTGKISAITTGWGVDYKSDLAFYSNTGVNGTNLTEKMRITSSGNVGIGTTSPLATLDVNGNQRLNGDLTFAADQTGYLIHALGNGGAIRIRSNITTASDRNVQFGAIDNNGIWSSYMIVDQGGNVGIGTISPDSKLAVNGTIHSKEVKVDLTSWPDYVFKPTYKLPLLSDIKNYITKNQHLPDMPSATEVEKSGINLGDIVRIQTKKIEELTLYLIKKDEQISDQGKQLADQQKINQRLQGQINELAKKLNK